MTPAMTMPVILIPAAVAYLSCMRLVSRDGGQPALPLFAVRAFSIALGFSAGVASFLLPRTSSVAPTWLAEANVTDVNQVARALQAQAEELNHLNEVAHWLLYGVAVVLVLAGILVPLLSLQMKTSFGDRPSGS